MKSLDNEIINTWISQTTNFNYAELIIKKRNDTKIFSSAMPLYLDVFTVPNIKICLCIISYYLIMPNEKARGNCK